MKIRVRREVMGMVWRIGKRRFKGDCRGEDCGSLTRWYGRWWDVEVWDWKERKKMERLQNRYLR